MPIFHAVTRQELLPHVPRANRFHIRHSYRPVPMVSTDGDGKNVLSHPDDPMKITMLCDACGHVTSLGTLVHEIWTKPSMIFRISRRNIEGQVAAIFDAIFRG